MQNNKKQSQQQYSSTISSTGSQMQYLLMQKRSKKKSYSYSLFLMLKMLRLLNSNSSGLVGVRQSHFLTLTITWNRIRAVIDEMVTKGFIQERGILKSGRGSHKISLKELNPDGHQRKYFFITPRGLMLLSKLEALDEILSFEQLQGVHLGTNRKISTE